MAAAKTNNLRFRGRRVAARNPLGATRDLVDAGEKFANAFSRMRSAEAQKVTL